MKQIAFCFFFILGSRAELEFVQGRDFCLTQVSAAKVEVGTKINVLDKDDCMNECVHSEAICEGIAYKETGNECHLWFRVLEAFEVTEMQPVKEKLDLLELLTLTKYALEKQKILDSDHMRDEDCPVLKQFEAGITGGTEIDGIDNAKTGTYAACKKECMGKNLKEQAPVCLGLEFYFAEKSGKPENKRCHLFREGPEPITIKPKKYGCVSIVEPKWFNDEETPTNFKREQQNRIQDITTYKVKLSMVVQVQVHVYGKETEVKKDG